MPGRMIPSYVPASWANLTNFRKFFPVEARAAGTLDGSQNLAGALDRGRVEMRALNSDARAKSFRSELAENFEK